MSISSMFKKQRHFQIERFGILFIVLTLAFIACIIAVGMVNKGIAENQSDYQASYTSSFTTSLSNQEGDVVGVFTNEAKTRAVVLMKFDDMEKMPTDAEKYVAWMAKYTDVGDTGRLSTMTDKPYGSIYVYGDTGYIALYLSNPATFTSEKVIVLMRNTAQLVGKASTTYTGSIESSKTNDQWTVIFNPGAGGTYTTASLDGDTFDADGFYADIIMYDEEQKLREQANEDAAACMDDLALIEEYTSRLEREGVVTTGMTPLDIVGDTTEQDEDGNVVLNTEHIAPNGFSFDWRSCSLQSGYLSALLGATTANDRMDYVDYVSQEDDDDLSDVSETVWTTTSGQKLDDMTASSWKSLQTAAQDLENAWTQYREDKKQYQTTDMLALFELEQEYTEATRDITVNSGDEAVLIILAD